MNKNLCAATLSIGFGLLCLFSSFTVEAKTHHHSHDSEGQRHHNHTKMSHSASTRQHSHSSSGSRHHHGSASNKATSKSQRIKQHHNSSVALKRSKKYNSRHHARVVPEPIAYLVYNSHQVFASKNADKIWPIASLTKLMTATVFTDNNISPQCTNEITDEDYNPLKHTRTRLPKNITISCTNLLTAMLMSSDNFAASALSRSLPGVSKENFVQMMNQKAVALGMTSTHFSDPSGLSPLNVSNIHDLTKLIAYDIQKNKILKYTQHDQLDLELSEDQTISLQNSNRLVKYDVYHPLLSKTGHIDESGYNLVHVQQDNCEAITNVVILGSFSSSSRASFANQSLKKACQPT